MPPLIDFKLFAISIARAPIEIMLITHVREFWRARGRTATGQLSSASARESSGYYFFLSRECALFSVQCVSVMHAASSDVVQIYYIFGDI